MKKRDGEKPTTSEELKQKQLRWHRIYKRNKVIKVIVIFASIILMMILALYILTLSGTLVIQGGFAGIFEKGDKNMADLSPVEIMAIPMYSDRVLLNSDKSINLNYFYDMESKYSPVNPREYLPPDVYRWTKTQVREAKTDRWYYKGILNDIDLFKKYLSEGQLEKEEFYLMQRFFGKIYDHPQTFDPSELFLIPEDRAYIEDIYSAYKQCTDRKEAFTGIQNLHNSTLYPANGFEGVSYQALYIGALYYDKFESDSYAVVTSSMSSDFFPFTDAAGDIIHLFQVEKISADHLEEVVDWGQDVPYK